MMIPLFLLGLGSIFIGYLTKDMIIGMGTHFWGNALFTLPQNILMLQSEFLPYYIKMIPVIFSIMGALMSSIVYILIYKLVYKLNITNIGIQLYTLFNKKYYVDIIYNEFIVKKLLSFGYSISFKLLDRGFIELFGPYGLSSSVLKFSNKLTKFQSGYIYHYMFVIFISITLLLSFTVLLNVFDIVIDFRLFFIWILLIIFSNFY